VTEPVEEVLIVCRVDEHELGTKLTTMVDITGEGGIRIAQDAQEPGKYLNVKADVCSIVQRTNSILHDSHAPIEFLRISCGGYLS
jgi:hypothetical protein